MKAQSSTPWALIYCRNGSGRRCATPAGSTWINTLHPGKSWSRATSTSSAISLPSTKFANDTPLGIQLVGRMGDEGTILNLAGQLEQARPWIQLKPPVYAGS